MRNKIFITLIILLLNSLSLISGETNSNEKYLYKNSHLPEMVNEITKGLNTPAEKIESIYYFVRDTIKFDFGEESKTSAEQILRNGRGTCIGKAALLIEMVRLCGIPARFHFMLVKKEALKDLIDPFIYLNWPGEFYHTVSEVYLNGKWVSMEATFDKELHNIILNKKINFAANAEYRNISIEFSEDGVIGAQQFSKVIGSEQIYADDRTPLINYIESIPESKRKKRPWALKKSSEWLNKKVR